MMSAGVTQWPPRTRGGGRMASVEALDAAQAAAGRAGEVPAPIAEARPRAARASHIRNSMPASGSTISSWWISSGDATMPSVRLKPSAKSSRSGGVAIITA